MRRSLFITIIAALVAFGVYRWLQLDQRLHGPSASAHYTPAEGPRIDPKDVQVLTALDAEYTRLVHAVIPSVVSITASRKMAAPQIVDPWEYLFGRRQQAAQDEVQVGSGVIVSQEGHILTNHHVIANMDKIEVQLTDGRTELAKLIGTDEQTDIAVLKITADKIEPLRLGDSDDVRVGQMVFAIGNPFGLQETVTQGIISAKGRRAMADSGVEFLQTDAAVNQGNSGGTLINLRGEIIGINSAIYSPSEESKWLGISFAIPSNVARRALESLLKTGRIIRGYLGVSTVNISQLSPEIRQQLGLSDEEGVVVVQIMAGSPAEAAGLKPGDQIRRFNGRAVPDRVYFRSRVAELDVHSKVQLTVVRSGKEQNLTIEVAEAPANLPSRPVPLQR